MTAAMPGRARPLPRMLVRFGWAAAVLVVLTQIPYPLVDGDVRTALIRVSVLLFGVATLSSVAATRGVRDALLLLIVAGGIGLGAEVSGVRTGIPFGAYRYTDLLGPRVIGVPLLVPLAWSAMAWPALCVARRLARSTAAGTAIAAVALASWDLFLDPQMVEAGAWRWAADGPAVAGVPLSNFGGWLLVALVIETVLTFALPAHPTDDRQPIALWLWAFGGSFVANLVFLGRPGVALLGGVGMGLVGAPLIARLTLRPGSRAPLALSGR